MQALIVACCKKPCLDFCDDVYWSEVGLELPDWVFLGPSCCLEQIGIGSAWFFCKRWDWWTDSWVHFFVVKKKDWSLLFFFFVMETIMKFHNDLWQSYHILFLIWAQNYSQNNTHSVLAHHVKEVLLYLSLNTYNAILLAEIIFNIERNGAQLAPKKWIDISNLDNFIISLKNTCV